ncbi:D-hexose-6-phosphate mutarotase [Paraglaciecola aquimarina]|uniref:Putative glucose-6-phosphate 1-epimerase n=1 Tax=Paraglaciecola aquimarina TaxID=1235557 RepID=A0ABU3SZU4_9ALTE|nr:D-hexose-6-phosphate mutarotase [Paraglaciecola aquimarina]MDU0355537.1 D-hexose-6-phosphate mutarotase [Paraglaciecola aquimarina]
MLLTDSTTIITRSTIQILQIDNALATAEISLFGGHILSFVPKRDNRERLWVSPKAALDGKKAIRGGVPICWPWFGDHKDSHYPAHGYVRNQNWQIINSKDSTTGTTVTLRPNASVDDGFSGDAQLTLVVEVGENLTIQLHTENLGNHTFSYNCALHSYFSIVDINLCQLAGIEGVYLDKTRGYDSFDTPALYNFSEETDRVHLNKTPQVDITDGPLLTSVCSTGHDSIIVWNPWQKKSISMADMSDNGYLSMVCVETAITQGQTVNPGETHVVEQVIS